MPFALDTNPEMSEVSEAINYLLANFGPNLAGDPVTGQITGPQGIVVGYLYRYMAIKYADSVDGSVNFSNVPTGRLYYGLANSDSTVESTNPADYIWYKAAGGFGTTKFLFYQTTGGRAIQFVVATTTPGVGWAQDTGTAVDLDIITAVTLTAAATPTIYVWTNSSTPPARPITSTTYTWATASYSAPAGWFVTPPSDTTPGDYLWAITIPIIANSTTTTTILDWTNTAYSIRAISYNGTNGTPGPNGLNAINAYLVQSQSAAAPTGFPQTTTGSTAPAGWSLTAPSVAVGQVLWYTQGQFNNSTTTINGISPNTTYWNNPVAASIFQDIRSDNWNGSTPPTAGTPSTYGTAGYYIQRSTGNMFLNSVYGRGIAQFDGANTGTGGYTAAILANQTLGQAIGVEAYANQTFITSGALRAFNQATGGGNALYASHSGTGNGILAQSASGTGIQATGVTGVLATGTYGVRGFGDSGGYGIFGQNNAGGTAIYANGYYGTNNNTLVTNLYSNYTQTMVGTTSNQLRFVSGTNTGTSTATFSGVKPGGASTNVWMTMQIDSTTIYIPVWT